MKRWAVAMLAILCAAGILIRFAPRRPEKQAAPPRRDPMVRVLRQRTGQHEEMPMEAYILGVVAAEMGAGFPDHALAAQAILARTYTVRRMTMGVEPSDDPNRFQAYDPTRITDKIRQAVAPTRGLVVVWDGELVDAVYHSCAGGRTASASEGLGGTDHVYLRPVADPPCRFNETWEARFGAAQVGAAAGVAGSAHTVAIGRRGPSGRAITMVVNGKEVSTVFLRGALGAGQMKSTLVTDMRVAGGQVLMSGRGYGHGVGLSQWGAATLAEQGFTPEEIIWHYYSDVHLEPRW